MEQLGFGLNTYVMEEDFENEEKYDVIEDFEKEYVFFVSYSGIHCRFYVTQRKEVEEEDGEIFTDCYYNLGFHLKDLEYAIEEEEDIKYLESLTSYSHSCLDINEVNEEIKHFLNEVSYFC